MNIVVKGEIKLDLTRIYHEQFLLSEQTKLFLLPLDI